MPSDYWKRRIEAEQRARLSRDTTLSDEMTRLYDYHFRELEKEIRAFEHRYADKNNLPIAEVKARVDALDVKAFEEKARRYVEEKDFSSKANAELGIYNLKMKMSRLELLQYQLDLEMVALANSEHKLSERFLNEEYTETLKVQSGLLGKSVLSASEIGKAAQTVLNTPFKGVKWSDRIWERQDALREVVARLTEDYLLKGKNPTAMIPQLRKEFGVSAGEAKRLAVTEGARVATEAEKQSYESNGYDEYEFIAEPSACDLCKPLDGKIFKVRDMEPGKNAAPMHPHCHCSTAAHFSESKSEYERLIKKSWKSQYPHMVNVTNKLIDGKYHEPKIKLNTQVIKNGVTYTVDGHNVVSDHSNEEHKVANWISSKTGMHVDILPRVNYPKNIKTPDYLIGGVPFDLKGFSGGGKYVIDNNARKAKEQTPNIIFDATKSPLSDEDLLRQLNDVYQSGRRGLEIAILKRGSEIVAVVQPIQKR
jgi:SPP1 gp7 family putative phage head morphogenesis protein